MDLVRGVSRFQVSEVLGEVTGFGEATQRCPRHAGIKQELHHATLGRE